MGSKPSRKERGDHNISADLSPVAAKPQTDSAHFIEAWAWKDAGPFPADMWMHCTGVMTKGTVSLVALELRQTDVVKRVQRSAMLTVKHRQGLSDVLRVLLFNVRLKPEFAPTRALAFYMHSPSKWFSLQFEIDAGTFASPDEEAKAQRFADGLWQFADGVMIEEKSAWHPIGDAPVDIAASRDYWQGIVNIWAKTRFAALDRLFEGPAAPCGRSLSAELLRLIIEYEGDTRALLMDSVRQQPKLRSLA